MIGERGKNLFLILQLRGFNDLTDKPAKFNEQTMQRFFLSLPFLVMLRENCAIKNALAAAQSRQSVSILKFFISL